VLLLPGEELPHEEIWSELEDMGDEIDESDPNYKLALYPKHLSKVRPGHNLFDSLAICMARAAKQMPKLERLLYRVDGLSGGCNEGRQDSALCFFDVGGARAKSGWIRYLIAIKCRC
jgi:hypothetical protein